MSTRTYSPKNIIITFNNPIRSFVFRGFAAGTFVTVERDEDAFEKKTGADGEVTRSQSRNLSGNLKGVFDQASPTNDDLNFVATLDEVSGTGIGTLLMTDAGGTTKILSASAWVKKKAASSFSKKSEDREWVIDLGQMDYEVGGSSLVNG